MLTPDVTQLSNSQNTINLSLKVRAIKIYLEGGLMRSNVTVTEGISNLAKEVTARR